MNSTAPAREHDDLPAEEECVEVDPYRLTLDELAALPFAVDRPQVDVDTMLSLSEHRWGLPWQLVRKTLSRWGFAYRRRSLAHINLRGGVGKTTCSISLATRAAQYGFKVCLIDLDPQASSSLALAVELQPDDFTFLHVSQQPQLLHSALWEIQPNLWLLPSSDANRRLAYGLTNRDRRRHAVRECVDQLHNLGVDLVIVDCPPNPGPTVESVFCGVDQLVVPVCGDVFSVRAAEKTLAECAATCADLNAPMPQQSLLYMKHDRRERACVESLAWLQQQRSGRLLNTIVRTSAEYNKALARGETVFGARRTNKARADMDRYARQILELPVA